MARLTLIAVLLAGAVLAGSALWMAAERVAPGLQVTAGPVGYADLTMVHGLSGLVLLPLLGAFAGFASAGRAARLVGWNGLAVAIALAVFLIAIAPELRPAAADAPGDALMPDFFPRQTPDTTAAIADAAGLWALYLGIGALLGASPGYRWAGRGIQLAAGLFCAAYLLGRAGGEPQPTLDALLLFPALLVFATATLQLTRNDTAPAPHLWTGSFLTMIVLIASAGTASFFDNDAGTLIETADIHLAVYALALFVFPAAWRSFRGRADGGGRIWSHALGLAALVTLWSRQIYGLGSNAGPQSEPEASGLAPFAMDAAVFTLLLVLWLAAIFILPARQSADPSVEHVS